MKLAEWGITLALVSSVILAGLYIAAFFRVERGSRIQLVAWMILLLLLTNVLLTANAVCAYFYQRYTTEGQMETASIYGQLENAFYAAADIAFGEAHWILAMHYYKTATNVPRVLRREMIVPSKTLVVMYWIGVALCAILPTVMGVLNVLQVRSETQSGKVDWLDDTSAASFACVQVSYVMIGMFSIWCVLLIQRYMNSIPNH